MRGKKSSFFALIDKRKIRVHVCHSNRQAQIGGCLQGIAITIGSVISHCIAPSQAVLKTCQRSLWRTSAYSLYISIQTVPLLCVLSFPIIQLTDRQIEFLLSHGITATYLIGVGRSSCPRDVISPSFQSHAGMIVSLDIQAGLISGLNLLLGLFFVFLCDGVIALVTFAPMHLVWGNFSSI